MLPKTKRFFDALEKHLLKFTHEEREEMIKAGDAVLSRASSASLKRPLRGKLPRRAVPR
jgi:hypothetical protein